MKGVPTVKIGSTAVHFTLDPSRTPWSGTSAETNRTYTFCSPICYELSFPPVVRDCVAGPAGVDRPADFMINISDDSWYQQSAELDQMLQMARLRCIENRRGMARCTATGISAFIAPTGHVRRVLMDETGQVKEVGPDVLTDRVDVCTAFSLYAVLGEWICWLALLCLVVAAGRRFIARWSRSSERTTTMATTPESAPATAPESPSSP